MDRDPVDPDLFWRLAPLPEVEPAPVGDPASDGGAREGGARDGGAGTGLDVLGRPEVTVDGRNLADVLRPVYIAITAE